MSDEERIRVLADAMDHQFDHDENAALVIATDDPLLLAAVDAVNEFGGWHEVWIAPGPELFRLLRFVESRLTSTDRTEGTD